MNRTSAACDTYEGPGVLRFECVVSPRAMMCVRAPELAFFSGLWVPRVLDMWPIGGGAAPLRSATPGPCSLQVLVEGRRQISEPWQLAIAQTYPVSWEAINANAVVEFVVEAGADGVHFLADLRCDIHSPKLEAT